MENLEKLVNELRKESSETNWLEFKCNNYDPEMIGKDISALANGAAYSEKSHAYMIWGIDDKTHDIVGTEYDQYTLKVGEQEIESWLRNMLSKNAGFVFYSIKMKDNNKDEKKIIVLVINKALNQTVTFKKVNYIRVGSYTKLLNDYPTMKAQLWDRIRMEKYEDLIAKKDLTLNDALNEIDYAKYFELRKEKIPTTINNIAHYMLEESLIYKQDNGLYSITNLGAILFAKNLSSFPHVSRKAIRVVKYNGNDRLEIEKEYTGNKGYAVGFENLMEWLNALLPSKEVFDGALRKKITKYPVVALRESIANALIHQDLSITGAGPLVEIFESRIEITNPGIPLVDINRIIDNPPRSRNEKLADLMRRMKMCEELGSGWDRIAISCEIKQLPAPKIALYEENTRVTIFSEVPFNNIVQEDKIWACYLHSCVKYVSHSYMTNKTLRDRFGLKETSSASISRLIKEAIKNGYIKPLDPNTAPRYLQYIPYWA